MVAVKAVRQDLRDELEFYRVDTAGMTVEDMQKALASIMASQGVKYLPFRPNAGAWMAVARALGITILVAAGISMLCQVTMFAAAYGASTWVGAHLDLVLAVMFGSSNETATAQLRSKYGDTSHEIITQTAQVFGALVGCWLAVSLYLPKMTRAEWAFPLSAVGIAMAFRVADFDFGAGAFGLIHLWMATVSVAAVTLNQCLLMFSARHPASQIEAERAAKEAKDAAAGRSRAAAAAAPRRCGRLGSFFQVVGFCCVAGCVLTTWLVVSFGSLVISLGAASDYDWAQSFTDLAVQRHYTTLGLDADADPSEVKRAYHKLSLKWHPDKCQEPPQVCQEQFDRVRTAYETIMERNQKRSRRSQDRAEGEAHEGSSHRPGGGDGRRRGRRKDEL